MDAPPDSLDTISGDPPALKSEVTIHYYSHRAGDFTTRTGVLQEYVDEDKDTIVAIISHSHEDNVTFVDFKTARVSSYTGNQNTLLGPLVALETDDDSVRMDAEVSSGVGGGAIQALPEQDSVFIFDGFGELKILYENELDALIDDMSDDEARNLKSSGGSMVPVVRNDLLRVKGRLCLARESEAFS